MIKSNRCAIFSDIHIGIYQDGAIWHNISSQWVKWFKEEAIKRDIRDIIFCGDFFHYRDSVATNTLSCAARILDELKDFNMVFVVGNHDCYYKESAEINSVSIFNGRDNITVVDVLKSIDISGRTITFVPWGSALEKIPKSDIVFGHFEIETFRLNSYKICDHGFKIDDLFKVSPLIISGHFHQRSERVTNKGTILYVGNPFQMDFGDVGGVKGVYFIDLETSKYEFIENTISPTFQKILLSTLVSNNTSLEDLKKIVKDNIVRVIIDMMISSDDADFLLRQFKLMQPIIFDVDHDIKFNMLMQSDDNPDFSGIDVREAITEFINIMDIDNKPAVTEYVLDLYKRVTYI